mgnify:CR=1 FL=1
MNVLKFRKRVKLSLVLTVLVLLVASAIFATPLAASDSATQEEVAQTASPLIWVVISAAVAFCFAFRKSSSLFFAANFFLSS